MDINATAKEYGNGVITSLKKNRRILIMMLLFAAGMIIGAVSLKRADSYLSGAFSDMFSVYIRSKGSQSLGMNFINSLAVNAAFMLAVFVFGLCAVGLPLICILPIIRGVGIGMLSILKFCSARAWVLRFGDISRAYTVYFCAPACLQCRNKFII